MQTESHAVSVKWHETVEVRVKRRQKSALHDRCEERGWDARSNRVSDNLYLHLLPDRIFDVLCQPARRSTRHQGLSVNLCIHLEEKVSWNVITVFLLTK
eukprot:3133536-Rhodomonas_salina.3